MFNGNNRLMDNLEFIFVMPCAKNGTPCLKKIAINNLFVLILK